MPRSVHFSNGTRSEQLFYEDIIVESIKIYGQDFFYIPRTLVGKDEILGEDRLSKFKNAYSVEMYLESHDGFEGQGAFIEKFGLMMEQSATLTVARRRWEQLVGQHGRSILPNRPSEGDLLYFPLTGGLFEIMFVKHQDPFYQLGQLYVYKLQVELFRYSSEHIDTGIKEIDKIEPLKTFDNDIVPDGIVTSIKVINKGARYTVPPVVQIGAEWQPNTKVVANQEVCINNRRYICTIPGTTGTVGPTWIQSVGIDGTATWQFAGYRASGVAYLGDRPDSINTVVKILVTDPGTGYSYPPTVYLVSQDGGLYAAGVALIDNLDYQESYPDNYKFKWEGEGIIFNENNPFGELSGYYIPPKIHDYADSIRKDASNTSVTTRSDTV